MSDPLLSIGSLGLAGDSGALSRLEKFDATALMAELMGEWGPIIRDAIKAEAPYSDDEDDDEGSVHLRDTIEYGGTEVALGGVTSTWTANVPWAEFVVEGTEEHEIHARVAKALHWVGPQGDAFAVSVDHPGTAPNPFPLHGFEKVEPALLAAFAELFKEI